MMPSGMRRWLADLGGKGASGRNMDHGARIEEHGLHVWAGFYENAFRMMTRCYEELGRPPGSPLATGAMFGAQTLPGVGLSAVAGVFADRWDRRRTMVASDLARAALLLPLLLVLTWTELALGRHWRQVVLGEDVRDPRRGNLALRYVELLAKECPRLFPDAPVQGT